MSSSRRRTKRRARTCLPGETTFCFSGERWPPTSLTAYPHAAATPDALFETLRGWGVDTRVATGIDLDGDGTNELLFQTPKDAADHLWVVYRSHGRWLADDSVYGRLSAFGAVVPLSRGHAVELVMQPGGARVAGGDPRGLTSRDGHLRWVDMASRELVGTMGTTDEWPSCDAEYLSRLQ